MKKPGLLPFFFLIALLSNTVFSADDIHYQDIKSLQNIIPQQSTYYTISSNVEITGEYYTFTIKPEDSADMQVTGIPSLIKTIHELSVIEWYKNTPQGNQVWKGAKDSVKNIGKGAKAIVMHPGDSFAALGRSVARTGRAIGGFFKGLVKKEPKSSTGEDLDKGAGNFMTADIARQAAYDLHLDVYSNNPLVIALLNEISKQQWAGSIGVSAASYFATPGLSTAGSIATGALTPGAAIDVTEKMIRDNSPSELNRELLKVVKDEMGYEPKSRIYETYKDFLDNPNYTPRQKAYFTLYLTILKDLKNFEQAVQVLQRCNSVENGAILFHQLQLLTALEKKAENIKFAAFTTAKNRIYAITTSGDLIAMLPFDYATNDKFMRNELAEIPQTGKSRSVWLLGDATPSFTALAKDSGFSAVYDGILRFAAFKFGEIKQ